MKQVPVNLNNYVTLKITERGLRVFREYHDRMGLDWEPYAKMNGEAKRGATWRMQMWQVMQIFGPSIYLGCDPPFDTNIVIETEDQHGS